MESDHLFSQEFPNDLVSIEVSILKYTQRGRILI